MLSLSRRDFVKSSGSLLVSVSLPGAVTRALSQDISTSGTLGAKPPLMPDELDSWIAVLPDGSVTAYFGKMDMGQGVDVAIAQMVAEELDVGFERVNVVMGELSASGLSGRIMALDSYHEIRARYARISWKRHEVLRVPGSYQ